MSTWINKKLISFSEKVIENVIDSFTNRNTPIENIQNIQGVRKIISKVISSKYFFKNDDIRYDANNLDFKWYFKKKNKKKGKWKKKKKKIEEKTFGDIKKKDNNKKKNYNDDEKNNNSNDINYSKIDDSHVSSSFLLNVNKEKKKYKNGKSILTKKDNYLIDYNNVSNKSSNKIASSNSNMVSLCCSPSFHSSDCSSNSSSSSSYSKSDSVSSEFKVSSSNVPSSFLTSNSEKNLAYINENSSNSNLFEENKENYYMRKESSLCKINLFIKEAKLLFFNKNINISDVSIYVTTILEDRKYVGKLRKLSSRTLPLNNLIINEYINHNVKDIFTDIVINVKYKNRKKEKEDIVLGRAIIPLFLLLNTYKCKIKKIKNKMKYCMKCFLWLHIFPCNNKLFNYKFFKPVEGFEEYGMLNPLYTLGFLNIKIKIIFKKNPFFLTFFSNMRKPMFYYKLPLQFEPLYCHYYSENFYVYLTHLPLWLYKFFYIFNHRRIEKIQLNCFDFIFILLFWLFLFRLVVFSPFCHLFIHMFFCILFVSLSYKYGMIDYNKNVFYNFRPIKETKKKSSYEQIKSEIENRNICHNEKKNVHFYNKEREISISGVEIDSNYCKYPCNIEKIEDSNKESFNNCSKNENLSNCTLNICDSKKLYLSNNRIKNDIEENKMRSISNIDKIYKLSKKDEVNDNDNYSSANYNYKYDDNLSNNSCCNIYHVNCYNGDYINFNNNSNFCSAEENNLIKDFSSTNKDNLKIEDDIYTNEEIKYINRLKLKDEIIKNKTESVETSDIKKKTNNNKKKILSSIEEISNKKGNLTNFAKKIQNIMFDNKDKNNWKSFNKNKNINGFISIFNKKNEKLPPLCTEEEKYSCKEKGVFENEKNKEERNIIKNFPKSDKDKEKKNYKIDISVIDNNKENINNLKNECEVSREYENESIFNLSYNVSDLSKYENNTGINDEVTPNSDFVNNPINSHNNCKNENNDKNNMVHSNNISTSCIYSNNSSEVKSPKKNFLLEAFNNNCSANDQNNFFDVKKKYPQMPIVKSPFHNFYLCINSINNKNVPIFSNNIEVPKIHIILNRLLTLVTLSQNFTGLFTINYEKIKYAFNWDFDFYTSVNLLILFLICYSLSFVLYFLSFVPFVVFRFFFFVLLSFLSIKSYDFTENGHRAIIYYKKNRNKGIKKNFFKKFKIIKIMNNIFKRKQKSKKYIFLKFFLKIYKFFKNISQKIILYISFGIFFIKNWYMRLLILKDIDHMHIAKLQAFKNLYFFIHKRMKKTGNTIKSNETNNNIKLNETSNTKRKISNEEKTNHTDEQDKKFMKFRMCENYKNIEACIYSSSDKEAVSKTNENENENENTDEDNDSLSQITDNGSMNVHVDIFLHYYFKKRKYDLFNNFININRNHMYMYKDINLCYSNEEEKINQLNYSEYFNSENNYSSSYDINKKKKIKTNSNYLCI
ncbi:conserved Plasmodium protein, unknown function [Plasmodium gallinaceum]|uniref:Uncharacterized protein n=1 Tax=Plasmodium gallinaceum TaxID=5849 RepID=A0A1J1GV96_PLAGA|nr:conserved Plasmodium protein, unknown function [Plasmodium gallinaceum]CRG96473.1 conserved Plasmodium protein, unknown function [Plasmodium gallinaceum]